MIALARWTMSALGALFLGLEPRAYCEPCGKRRSVGHFDREHGRNGRYWS